MLARHENCDFCSSHRYDFQGRCSHVQVNIADYCLDCPLLGHVDCIQMHLRKYRYDTAFLGQIYNGSLCRSVFKEDVIGALGNRCVG